MALIINGEEISEWTLEEEFDAIKEHHESLGEVVCCDRDEEFRARAKENVINRTLLNQEYIKRNGKLEKKEIDEALSQLKEDHGGEEEFYKNVGMGADQDDQIREKVANTLTVEKLLREHVGDDPETDEKTLKKFYQDHIDDYKTEEEVRAWHIYLEPHSPDEAETLFAKLREVRQELLDGADFEEMSNKLCREDHHMDLGFYKRGGLMQEVEIITFSMNVGEISPVVATHFGYHVFKLIERKEPKPIPFKDLKDQVEERFLAESREGKINELLGQLKSDAKIEDIEESEEEPEMV